MDKRYNSRNPQKKKTIRLKQETEEAPCFSLLIGKYQSFIEYNKKETKYPKRERDVTASLLSIQKPYLDQKPQT